MKIGIKYFGAFKNVSIMSKSFLFYSVLLPQKVYLYMFFLLKIDVQVHTVKLKETVTSENQKIL